MAIGQINNKQKRHYLEMLASKLQLAARDGRVSAEELFMEATNVAQIVIFSSI